MFQIKVAEIKTHVLYSKHFPKIILFVYEISWKYEGWNFNSGNYLFTTDTK